VSYATDHLVFIIEIISGFLLAAVSPSHMSRNEDIGAILGIVLLMFIVFIVWIVLFIYGLTTLRENIHLFQEIMERDLEYEKPPVKTTLEPPEETVSKHQEIRYCPYCGAPLSKGARFCPYCGAKLR
jgi:hypothetical protein